MKKPLSPRTAQVRQYVVERLRKELTGEWGEQAQLARELHVSTAHISNLLSHPPGKQPGEQLVRKCAERWGMTYAELEAAACGESAVAGLDEARLRAVLRELLREELAVALSELRTEKARR